MLTKKGKYYQYIKIRIQQIQETSFWFTRYIFGNRLFSKSNKLIKRETSLESNVLQNNFVVFKDKDYNYK